MNGTPDPYVKVTLRSKEGKRLMKKRTHVKRAAKNPVFNESFILQLPPTNVKNVVMDVQVREHSSSLLNRKLLFPVESAIPVGIQRECPSR